VSIQTDAQQAIGEILFLDSAFPNSTVAPASLPPPTQDYGGLPWVPFVQSDGSVGYWAPKGDGTYYYFGPNGTLYDDSYIGQVQASDMSTNAIGVVSTYNFASADPSYITSPYTSSDQVYYGGIYV
jgi:hypothetical protein